MGRSRGNDDRLTGWRRVATWRGATTLAVVVLAAFFVVPVARGGETSSSYVWLALTATIAIVLVVYVLLSLLVQFAGVDADAPVLAQLLAAHPDQRRLLTRWLERARWARFVGGFCGVLTWLLATNAQGGLLLYGTAGIFLGAVAAELHHVRRPSGPRTARLEVRTVREYLLERDERWMIGVAAVAAVCGLAGVWRTDTRAATWWAAAALGVLAVTRVMQQRVASRARPAVSPELTRADDLARELAIGRGLARPATYLGLAILSKSAERLEPMIGGVAVALAFGFWVTALVRWWQNRRLGLDFLMQVPHAPVVS